MPHRALPLRCLRQCGRWAASWDCKRLRSPNDATGDFFAGITGWVCVEIVWHSVYDDCSSEYFPDCKPGCHKGAPGGSVIHKDRGQISCVCGVFTIFRVVMAFGIGKGVVARSGTRSAFMDVESKYKVPAVARLVWNSIKRRGHEDGISNIIKRDDTPQTIIFFRTKYLCRCLWGCGV